MDNSTALIVSSCVTGIGVVASAAINVSVPTMLERKRQRTDRYQELLDSAMKALTQFLKNAHSAQDSRNITARANVRADRASAIAELIKFQTVANPIQSEAINRFVTTEHVDAHNPELIVLGQAVVNATVQSKRT